jgi:hypothetical protein
MGGMKKKPAKGATVTGKCAVISRALLSAETLPSVVGSMLAGKLDGTFGTYKEERHPYQVAISKMVGEALASEEKALAKAIADANAKKAGLETEHAAALGASNEAKAAASAAAAVADEKKAALAASKEALTSAKTALETAKESLEKAEEGVASPTGKKAKAESLVKDVLTPLKEGTVEKAVLKKAVSDAKYIAKEGALDDQFTGFLAKALADPSGWRTFEKLVVKEFEEELAKIIAKLDAELAAAEPVKVTATAAVGDAGAAVTAADEAVKAAAQASVDAGKASSEAAAAAKAAALTCKPETALIDKAAKACAAAEDTLAAFKSGPLAAYAEVEAYAKPPEPVAPAPEAAAAPPAA